MTRESVTLQPAFLLHQRAFRDTSRIADFLCPDHGRVALVARGVQRPRSRLRAVLMPFQCVAVSWVRKGDLGTLTAAEVIEPTPPLPSDALMSGWYVNELVMRLVQGHDAQHEVFDLYRGVLTRLRGGQSPAVALRAFEKRMLDVLGYGLPLTLEADGHTPVAADAHYRYRPGRGPERVLAPAPDEQLVDGRTLLAMARDAFDEPGVADAARPILATALAAQLGERPLRVRDVARSIKRAQSSPLRDAPSHTPSGETE